MSDIIHQKKLQKKLERINRISDNSSSSEEESLSSEEESLSSEEESSSSEEESSSSEEESSSSEEEDSSSEEEDSLKRKKAKKKRKPKRKKAKKKRKPKRKKAKKKRNPKPNQIIGKKRKRLDGQKSIKKLKLTCGNCMQEFGHPFLGGRVCNDCDETFCVDCSKGRYPFEDELEKEMLWGDEDVTVLPMIKECNNDACGTFECGCCDEDSMIFECETCNKNVFCMNCGMMDECIGCGKHECNNCIQRCSCGAPFCGSFPCLEFCDCEED